MPKIPRTEATVPIKMADQPPMNPDALTGPGKALQGLGRAIAGLGGAFDAMSQPGDQDILSAQLAQMDAATASEKYYNERLASFTPDTDPDTWHQETTKGIGAIWDDASGRVPAYPKLQHGFAVNRHRFTGNYDVRAHGFATKEKTERFATGALETFKRGLDTIDPTTPEGIAAIDTIEKQLGRVPGLDVEKARDALASEMLKRFEAEAEKDPIKALEKIQAIEKWRDQIKAQPQQGQGVGPQSSIKPIMDDSQRAKLEGVDERVVDKLSLLQGEMGRRFKINSGYRSKAHNKRVGGASKSQHIHGNAVDLDVSSLSDEERTAMIAKASALGFTGIGVYNNAIHLDIGGRRAWGSDYTHKTVPSWARSAIETHMRGGFAGTQVAESGMGGGIANDAPDYRGKRGPASIRFNNPGAMYPGPSSRKFGAVETKIIGGGHKIAVFPDAVSGAAAQFDLLSRNYTGKTLGSAIAKWAGGNSVGTYLKVIERETGITANTVLTKEMVADPRIAVPIAKAMAVQEAGREYPMSDAQWMQAHQMFSGGTQVASSAPNAAPAPGRPEPVQVADASGRIGAPSGGQIAERVAGRIGGQDQQKTEPNQGQRAENTIPGTQTAQGLSPQEFMRQQQEAQDKASPGQVRTQNEVWDNPSIRTHVLDKLGAVKARVSKLAEKQLKEMEGALRVSRFLTQEEQFNRYDDDARKLVNDTFKLGDLHTRILSGDPDAIARGVEVSKRLGYVPEVVQDSLLAMVKDRAPSKAQLRMAGYQAAGAILADYPDAFMGEDGNKLASEARDFLAMADGMGPEQAMLRMDEMKSPEWEKKKAALGPLATEALKSIDPISIMRDAFDPGILSFAPGADWVAPAMTSDFQQKFRDNFIRIGDADAAKKLTIDEMRRTYGVSSISGSAQIMRFPVETHYPAIGPKGHAYIGKDVETAVRAYLDDKDGAIEVGSPDEGKAVSGITADKIYLEGDHITARELAAGKSPSYQVWYVDEKTGLKQMIPDRIFRWSMQPQDIRAQQSKYRTQQMSKRKDVLGGVPAGDPDMRNKMQAEDARIKERDANSPYAPSVLLKKGAKRIMDYINGNGDLPMGMEVAP